MSIIVSIKKDNHTSIYGFKHKLFKYWYLILKSKKEGYEIEVTNNGR